MFINDDELDSLGVLLNLTNLIGSCVGLVFGGDGVIKRFPDPCITFLIRTRLC